MTADQDENNGEEKNARRVLSYEINLARVPKKGRPMPLPYVANIPEEQTQTKHKRKLQYVANIPEEQTQTKHKRKLPYSVRVPDCESVQDSSLATADLANLISLQEILATEFSNILPEKVKSGKLDDSVLTEIMETIFNKKYHKIEYVLKKPEKNIMR
jgi:hypothetical protein